MAVLYYVGGTGQTWNTTAGTKWATSSGGAGGAAAPTAADDVMFDANSGVGTITLSGTTVARSINFTGFAGTISHPAATSVSIGDGTAGASSIALKTVAGMTYTVGNATTSILNFISTAAAIQTLTTGGKTWPSYTINGAGSSYQLADNNTVAAASTVTLTAGSFDTNGKSCSWGFFSGTGATTRTLTLGASAISLTGSSGVHWNLGTTTALTFNAGTSVITLNNTSTVTFSGGGLTYYDVVCNHPSSSISATISGANTFRNFTFTFNSGTSTSSAVPSMAADQVVTGTFTATGFSATSRPCFATNDSNFRRTITAAAVSITNVDFIGIGGAGTGTWSGTSIGDGGNNSGITFTTPVTRYWVGGAGNWNDSTHWSASSGGAGGASLPLPQDSVILDSNSGTGNSVKNMNQSGGDIDCTGYTGTLTMSNASQNIFGNLKLSSGMTAVLTGTVIFRGDGIKTIDLAGKSYAAAVTFAPGTGNTRKFLSDFATSSTITHNTGTLDANNFNVSCAGFTSSNTNTRTINMGSGTWTFNGTGSVWSTGTSTNLSVQPGTSTIVVSDTSATGKTISFGGITINNLTIIGGGTGAIQTAAASVNVLTITGPKTVQWTPLSLMTVNSFNVVGTPGNLITLKSSTAGSKFTLSSTGPIVSLDYVTLQDCTATGGAYWAAGNNSVDNGNNSGWVFGAATFSMPLSDSVTTADAASKQLPTLKLVDSVTVTESIVKGPRPKFADTVSSADIRTSIQGFGRAFTDSVSSSDSRKSLIGAGRSDIIVTVDDRARSMMYHLVDTASAVEAAYKYYSTNRSDAVTSADQATVVYGIGYLINDLVNISDAQRKTIGAGRSDTATMIEAASKIFAHKLSDIATIAEQISKRPLLRKADTVTTTDALKPFYVRADFVEALDGVRIKVNNIAVIVPRMYGSKPRIAAIRTRRPVVKL